MRKYSVTEIAKLLNVNEETVRRWIRFEGLKATQTSKKTGYVIDELDLFEFIQTKPKYRKIMCLPEPQIDDTYSKKLNDLLSDLIAERDRLDNRINKIQALLEEL